MESAPMRSTMPSRASRASPSWIRRAFSSISEEMT